MDTDLLKRKLMDVKSKYSQGVTSDGKGAATGSGTDDSGFLHAKSVNREANKVPPKPGPAEEGLGPKSFTGLAVSELLFVEILLEQRDCPNMPESQVSGCFQLTKLQPDHLRFTLRSTTSRSHVNSKVCYKCLSPRRTV